MPNLTSPWIFANFGLLMFIVATLIALLHKLARRRLSLSEIIYRWYILFPVGLNLIYCYFMHVFYPVSSAALLGWLNSPFQFEVAMASLGFGLIAILSFNASFGFRLASTLGVTCWFWGLALIYAQQMILTNTISVTAPSSIFWLDFFLPIILLLCLWNIKRREKTW